jgi:hypothetical protein
MEIALQFAAQHLHVQKLSIEVKNFRIYGASAGSKRLRFASLLSQKYLFKGRIVKFHGEIAMRENVNGMTYALCSSQKSTPKRA